MPYSFLRYFSRTHWLLVHRYLALSLGLLFAIIGLSGSISVYRDEIDELLNPQLVITPLQSAQLSPDQLIHAVRAAHPNRHGVWTLEMPRSPHGAVTAWFDNPAETTGAYYAPLMVSIHPYTGKVLASRFWGQTFTTWMLNLHSQLLADGVGRNLLASLAVLLSVSVCSGVYLWWPGWARLPTVLKIRHNAGLSLWLFDLHRWGGILSACVLLLLAFTGFHLAYPPLLETLTASAGMGHGDAGPNVRSTAVPNERPVSLVEAVLVARGPFPSSEVRRITTPRGETGTYRINLRQRQEVNQHHPMTNVWIDRWSGQIRDVQNPEKLSAAQRFALWMWPLHTGEAFGETARLLWFFTGFMPLLLWLSGGWYWLCRHGIVKDYPVNFPLYWQQCLSGFVYVYRYGNHWLQRLKPKAFVLLKQILNHLNK